MIDIKGAANHAEDDMYAVQTWVIDEYTKYFAEYFEDVHNLSVTMASTVTPITDEELEFILVDLPLKLFSAAEQINKLTLNLEVMKLKNKKVVTEKIKQSKESTATMRKDAAEAEIFEDRVLEMAYSCLLDRVQREITYSRELIMGAKKVWDSRKRGESVNPVSEVPSTSEKVPVYT